MAIMDPKVCILMGNYTSFLDVKYLDRINEKIASTKSSFTIQLKTNLECSTLVMLKTDSFRVENTFQGSRLAKTITATEVWTPRAWS